MNFKHSYITDLRKKKRLNQEELGKAVGMSQTKISRFETGEQVPLITELLQIADFFGVSVDEFLENNNEPQIRERVALNDNIDAEYEKNCCGELFKSYREWEKPNQFLYKIIDEQNKIIQDKDRIIDDLKHILSLNKLKEPKND